MPLMHAGPVPPRSDLLQPPFSSEVLYWRRLGRFLSAVLGEVPLGPAVFWFFPGPKLCCGER